MNKKIMTLMVVPALLLSSCTSIFGDTSKAKNINVYNLDLLEEKGDLQTAKEGTVKARFFKNKEHVPYVSLKQYASLYEPHFQKGVTSTVKREGFTDIVWSIYVGDEPYFVAQISPLYKEVLFAGSISSALKEDDDPQDVTALLHGLDIEYTGDYIGDRTYNVCDFGEYGINYYSYNGEYYFPLTFFDLTFSGDSSVYFYYNYNGIYATHDVETYSTTKFTIDNKEYTVDSQMKEANSLAKIMPQYLRELNANMFFYVVDNFYGLKKEKGFSSMKALCREAGLYDFLLSSNPKERAQAYADALSLFDDNHTAIVSANDTWGEEEFGNFKYAKGVQKRSALRSQMTALRKSSYTNMNKQIGDIVISEDGLTAMYVFDSFTFGSSEEVFNEDGSIDYETARKVDSFYDLVYVFNYLKTTSVKNVILDITTNGGGVLGVLMKILCLISKNDESYFYYYDNGTTQLTSAHCRVDINEDEKYDANDCYGNDFNFFILSTDCSFSCANAFPCCAKAAGTAKIIGEKSGGGECVVGIHYLPNSQYVYHSSNMHLGNYDGKTNVFTGFEGGAEPDIAISDYADFYDIEKLNNLVKTA